MFLNLFLSSGYKDYETCKLSEQERKTKKREIKQFDTLISRNIAT
jgi:hypothetical protein